MLYFIYVMFCFIFLDFFIAVFGRFIRRVVKKTRQHLVLKAHLGASQKMRLFYPWFFSLPLLVGLLDIFKAGS